MGGGSGDLSGPLQNFTCLAREIHMIYKLLRLSGTLLDISVLSFCMFWKIIGGRCF